jgi:3-phosphoshikimate 1-carboxyvinyltransferase
MNCFRALGCNIEMDDALITVEGSGYKNFTKPAAELDCGNSGTTSRLITGILAAQGFETTLVGDESLSKRPMNRIVDPLTKMGAKINTTEAGTLPMTILPSDGLHAMQYEMEVASAQVKSAVLLAGLQLEEETTVTENISTRNHTEQMLGLPVVKEGNSTRITVSNRYYPTNKDYFVPSDISTSAFFIVLALLLKNSELIVENVLLNETRTGIINVLQKMGGSIEVTEEKISSGEKYGNLLVRSGDLKNTSIDAEIIPNIIDEIPILAVAGIFAEGSFTIRNAKELRVKESDRINSVCSNFRKLGLSVDEYDDGFTVAGEIQHSSVTLESFGDHRIAMAMAVLGFVAGKDFGINNFECVAVSNPDFITQINSLT